MLNICISLRFKMMIINEWLRLILNKWGSVWCNLKFVLEVSSIMLFGLGVIEFINVKFIRLRRSFKVML